MAGINTVKLRRPLISRLRNLFDGWSHRGVVVKTP